MVVFMDSLGLCPKPQLGVSPPTPPLGETPQTPCKNRKDINSILLCLGVQGVSPLLGSGVKPKQGFGDRVPNIL